MSREQSWNSRATVGVSVLVFCLAVAGCRGSRETLQPEATSSKAEGPMVTIESVVLRDVQRQVGLLGTLHGYEEVSLGAKVGGRVQTVDHEIGDRVAAGEILIEIESIDHQLNVQQAQRSLNVEIAKLGLEKPPASAAEFDVNKVPMVMQARSRLDNARTRLERIRQLVAKRAASEEELSDRMSEFRVAESEHENQIWLAKAALASIHVKQEALAIAQQQLRDCVVRAPVPSKPIPGDKPAGEYVIVSRLVSEGSYVMPGDELYKLMIDRPIKFRGTVPERKMQEVRQHQTAYVVTSAYKDPFVGEVTRIDPAIDSKTRTFEVEVLLPNKNLELKPGGFAKAAIFTSVDPQTPTVPLEAVVHFAGVTKIFLYEAGQVKEVQVTLGVQETDWVEISAPRIPVGAQVVTSGQTAIADGSKVAIRESTRPTAPRGASEARRLAAPQAESPTRGSTGPPPLSPAPQDSSLNDLFVPGPTSVARPLPAKESTP